MGSDGGTGVRFRGGIYSSPRPVVQLPWATNLVEFLFSSDSHGSRPALIDASTGYRLSASELHNLAINLAAGLRSLGVRQGDVVMLVAPNSLKYPIVVFAVLLLGGVITTVNPMNTPTEVSKQAKDSDSKFVFTVSALLPKVSGLGLPTVLMDNPAEPRSHKNLLSMADLLARDPIPGFKPPKTHPEDTAVLLYSSGTTGTSKGVILSHKNLIAAAVLHAASGPGAEAGEMFLCVIPMFHVFGFVIVTVTQLHRGVPIVVMGSFHLQEMLAAVERFRITHIPLVPPIIIGLTKSPLVESFDLGSLREIGSGAAPLGRELINACLARFPGVKIRQGYGLTESTAIATAADPDDVQHYGAAGLIAPNTNLKVVDVKTGRCLPPNEQGEIWLHGPTIMQGYLRNPKATAETLDSEGWLHTGDLGYVDDSGNVYVVDRIKELIKYKGYQVAPAELEALLLSHPQVLDVAVIPYPDEEAGEVPLAVVVRRPGNHLEEENVIQYIAHQVAPYKKIRKVIFVDAIPKSASGKILRRELIRMHTTVSKL